MLYYNRSLLSEPELVIAESKLVSSEDEKNIIVNRSIYRFYQIVPDGKYTHRGKG